LELNVSKFNDMCGTTGGVLKEYKKYTLTECCKTMPTAMWTYSMKYENCINGNEINAVFILL
jgi:hypothetical protein